MKNSRNATALLRSASRSFLNLLYPRRCPLCHQILENQRSLICPKCRGRLAPITGPVCMKCGRPVAMEREYCRDCEGRERYFDQGKGIFLYDDMMRASLGKYKLHGCREYGRFYGEAMYRYGKKELCRWKPELIVPVPLYPRKKRMRGFNQAEDLAEALGRHTGILAAGELVVKVRDTGEQKRLGRAQRRSNLKGAFFAKSSLSGERVLLVDDVYTTGSTLEALALCLKENGAGPVFFLTLCIGAQDNL